MKDLLLNVTNHDVEVDAYDLSLVEDQGHIAQSLRIRLLLFLGEWFLDTDEGVPFFQDVFKKNPNLGAIEAALKQRILGTPGVTELISFSLEFNESGRQLTVDFEANTTFGVVTITETI